MPGQPSVFRFSSRYFHLVFFIPPDAYALVGRPAFNVVKILVGHNGLVGVVQTDKYFINGTVKHNVYNGTVITGFRVLLFRLFVFVFRAEVEFFRADNKRFAFRFKKVAFADKFGDKAGVG